MRTAIVAAAVAVGALALPASASAQPQQNGLVNVYLNDVITENAIGVGVAANVVAQLCDTTVNAAVLAQQVVRDGGTFECSTAADLPVEVTPST